MPSNMVDGIGAGGGSSSSSGSSSSGSSGSWRYTRLPTATVVALQRKLGIPADGIYGPQTRDAVRRYQQANGLAVDGIAGPQTLGHMGLVSSGASAPPSPQTAAPVPSPSTGAQTPGTSPPAINEQIMASRYGMALAVINSDPSLRAVFDQAIANDWTEAEFVARARETDWYRKNSETARQSLVLKSTDPATWDQRVNSMRHQIAIMANQIGAPISRDALMRLAEQAITFGWNTEQVRLTLSQYVVAVDDRWMGQAAQWETELRDYAQALGIKPTDKWMQGYLQRAAGDQGASVETGKEVLRQMAASAFPHLAERIEAGETLEQIASGYIETMARTLELNPSAINLDDPKIRGALAATGQDGKPTMKSIWEFEKELRRDPRWSKTKNAQNEVSAVVRQIGTDFGLAF